VIPNLTVVGLGLIGGSLARALREAGAVQTITGFDSNPLRCAAALSLGVVDHIGASAADAVKDADLVLLSVPVLDTQAAMAALMNGLKPGAVVTDAGSTKQSVLDDVKRACNGAIPSWFVPGHPIAGTEKSGVENSSATLFKNHRVILTPHPAQDSAAKALVVSMWQAAGARVVEMEPHQHDTIFAATSHLPHLLAYSFVDMLNELDEQHEIFPNAGGGFRDFTRIASSSPQMWHDIVRANKQSVSEVLDRQIAELRELRQMIAEDRWDEVRALFERARAARERYLAQIE
jgi:prephenate dehydrogenase